MGVNTHTHKTATYNEVAIKLKIPLKLLKIQVSFKKQFQ